MTEEKKKTVSLVLSIMLGVVFVFAAVMKFDYAPELEKEISRVLGSGGLGISILARALIAFELAIGLSLCQPNWRKRIILPLALVTLAAFSVYLVSLDPKTPNCGCLGNWPPMSPLESLIKNAILAVIGMVALVLHPRDRKGTILAPILSLVAAVGLTFAIRPPSANDGFDMTILGPFHNQKSSPLKGLTLVCFLNSTCEHCEEASMDLQDFHIKTGMPVFFVLDGSEAEIKQFFEVTGTEDMPWQIATNRSFFFSAIGKAPPRYHLVKDGRSITYWDGKFDGQTVIEAVKKVAKGQAP